MRWSAKLSTLPDRGRLVPEFNDGITREMFMLPIESFNRLPR